MAELYRNKMKNKETSRYKFQNDNHKIDGGMVTSYSKLCK
jgi:hypothetical protein